MNRFSRVLCAVDPCSGEQTAVDRAAWYCGNANATLELFSCFFDEYLNGRRFGDAPSLERARNNELERLSNLLEDLAEPLRERGLRVITTVVWDRPLHEGIIRHAAKTGADLIVKDTQYHSVVGRALLSNADWQLIRTCAVPLWLVKPTAVNRRPVFIAAIDPMNEYDKAAELDDQIVVTGKSLAAISGGKLHTCHTYDPRAAFATASASAYLPASLSYDEIDEQIREQHGKRVREITEFHGIDEQRTHLLSGRTEDELPYLVDSLRADVVVQGAVARNHWKRLFVGSTAERTLDRLRCDLLIVKPGWFETPDEILTVQRETA